nr:MAG TPA: hypothetical protein [Caudoviricetes sp.]
MHGDDETPIWDFVCWAVPATIVLISVFMLTLLIGTALGGSL